LAITATKANFPAAISSAKWLHHVALPAEMLRVFKNSEVIFTAAAALSVAQPTYALRATIATALRGVLLL
jgi:hypothetical protein